MVPSTWLTAVRVARLAAALSALPSAAPGVDLTEAHRRAWRQCGGPFDDIPTLVRVLIDIELVTAQRSSIRRSSAGQRALRQDVIQTRRPIGVALLRAGYFHDQARLLIELCSMNDDGSVTCATREARRAAPQLLGVLQFWPEVVVSPAVIVPAELVAELGTVWALLPPTDEADGSADAMRKSIGNRAELYTYQLERLRAASLVHIAWVARDDPDLGYDVEDRSTAPHRRIEVKGSGGPTVRFFLSENEWQKAHDDPATYEIQFWGGIDLNRDIATEYDRLRGAGYPLIFRDLPYVLGAGELVATPNKWRVVGAGPSA